MFHRDFKEFIGLLNSHGVEYLLVGGYALGIHGYPPLRIDLLTQPDGVEFPDSYAQRLDVEYDGLTIHVISLEDFKKNKTASGRSKDLEDLKNLE
ncbi:hypothetical protein [Thiothrix nivea]|uniref:Nucleotidyltransferase n=1 Tax=Thiothrix nivea (strain ATCC 35100 / DSM 5205 / JP2) TaxID=870187 RepID=A0A656HJM7_THINJ|nr:hypothetical protein [Thiothrix nivea]EIJ35706.1 hypothetical protein Thini_3184 [Thiothrix nivea DSM 5205]